MQMPGRKYDNGSGYRYGFNGKENDNEIKGEGDQQDYGMRIYDPRLGKFLSVDPITADYPELTPYQFASNSPIDGVDRDGLEFSSSKLKAINKTIAALKTVAGPMAHGVGDGIADANSFGISDHMPDWSGCNTNNGNEYEGIEKISYFVGRALGATIVLDQALGEGGAAAGMAGSGVGVLPAIGVGAHALAVASTATYDLSWAMAKLLALGVDLNADTGGESTDDGPNNQNNSAHNSPDPPKPNSSNASSSNTAKAKDLKLLHKEETITKSAEYQKIKNMSDKELIESVTNPSKYNKVRINTETGKLVDGNTRIYEIQRRGLDVNVPLEKYSPDKSHLPDLKEPPKKTF
jgi:RHS repeat-associated protein